MKKNKMKTTLNTLLTVILAGTLFTSCTKKEGCTDPAATNFNVEAEKDDGTCTYATLEEIIIEEETEAEITINSSQL
jgi:hypothetical protein